MPKRAQPGYIQDARLRITEASHPPVEVVKIDDEFLGRRRLRCNKGARPAAMLESRIQGPKTSSRFRENEARLEAADTAHDRGNEGQAATDLPHDAINNGEPETAAGADR